MNVAAADAVAKWIGSMSLEDMLTHELAFGLSTASPLQRAICRVAEGSPLGMLAADPAVVRAFGGSMVLDGKPRELAIVAGVRTGKTLLAACMAVHAAFTCDVSALGPGEVPRVACVSTSKDNAGAIFEHIKGRVTSSPLLRTMLVDEPKTDSLTLMHPSGRPVEVCVVAGSRAGSSLVSRWMAAVIFDEYAKMVESSDDGVVNWKDCRRAVLERILPGGYLAHITSPWAPFGPAYTHVQEHWGKPSKAIVVLRARAGDLNPVWWTPERIAEAEKADPVVYRTDVLAEFSAAEESLMHPDHVDAALRETDDDVPRVRGGAYSAAMDPATRGNGWTFVVATRDGDTRSIVAAREWLGTSAEPLSPRAVLAEVATLCRAYGIDSVDSDNWSGDALRDLAAEVGLSLVTWPLTDKERTARYLAMRTMLELGRLELPNIPRMRGDLMRLKKRVTTSGASIALPLTSDGRHCDWAPTLMLAIGRYLDDVERPAPLPTEDERVQADLERMRADAMRRYGGAQEDDYV